MSNLLGYCPLDKKNCDNDAYCSLCMEDAENKRLEKKKERKAAKEAQKKSGSTVHKGADEIPPIRFRISRSEVEGAYHVSSIDPRAKVEDAFVVLEANLFNSLVNLRDKYFHDGIWVVFEIV